MKRLDPKISARKIREVVGNNPKALAIDAGLGMSAIYNYITGKRIPSVEALFAIAQATRRPMEWFLVDETKTEQQNSTNCYFPLSTPRAAN